MNKTGLVGVGVLVAVFGISLVRLDQAVQGQWGQVEGLYQRRADLVPTLVESVKGAAKFERQTMTAVTQARAQLGQLGSIAPGAAPGASARAPNDPAAFQKYQEAQSQLSSALSRLMGVAERYPELKSTAGFRDLQGQLEETENRVAVERMRFNQAAQEFNTARRRFPTIVFVGLWGARFAAKPYFQAQAGAGASRVHF
jgi:LemA protein